MTTAPAGFGPSVEPEVILILFRGYEQQAVCTAGEVVAQNPKDYV